MVNSLIEFHCEKTIQDGTYVSLVGCLSCFDRALYEVNKIIEKILNIVQDTPNVFIFGEIYPYDKEKFIMILSSEYEEKRKVFESMYHERINVCPSKFYEEYKRNNSILSKIKKCFKKQRAESF